MDPANFSDEERVDDLDVFLEDAGPDEHEDWNELADAYYGAFQSLSVPSTTGCSFPGRDGGSTRWDEWYGSDDATKRHLASKAAEEMAAEYADSYGVPAPEETYGLDNLDEPIALPSSSIEIGKLLFHFSDLEVISELKLFETLNHDILVASDDTPSEAIGQYKSLDDVKNAIHKAGWILASFWSADNEYASEWTRW